MPLYKKVIKKNYTLVIWYLTELEDAFTRYKEYFSSYHNNFEKINREQRRKEWLCSRDIGWNIAKEMEGKCAGIWSDEYNKPYIKNSTLHISFSHAKPYVAVLVHRNKSCGIDIEEKKEKLHKVSAKFLTKNELNQVSGDLTSLAIAWGAKEAIYKLHGRKRLIFKENIALYGLDTLKKSGVICSEFAVNGKVKTIHLEYSQFENHILVHT